MRFIPSRLVPPPGGRLGAVGSHLAQRPGTNVLVVVVTGQMTLFCMFLVGGGYIWRIPREHGENMQTPIEEEEEELDGQTRLYSSHDTTQHTHIHYIHSRMILYSLYSLKNDIIFTIFTLCMCVRARVHVCVPVCVCVRA